MNFCMSSGDYRADINRSEFMVLRHYQFRSYDIFSYYPDVLPGRRWMNYLDIFRQLFKNIPRPGCAVPLPNYIYILHHNY